MPGTAGSSPLASRPCLLVNPRSYRASRHDLAGRVTRLALQAGLEVHEIYDPDTARACFDNLRARRQRQVWLLAGDGSIHAIAEYLSELPVGDWSPALLLLAGGRANVVPRECGGYPAMPALRRALAALRAGRALAEQSLPTLRVTQEGAPVRHGFFLAGGVIHHGIRYCSEHRAAGNGWLNRSWFADPWALLKLSAKVWFGRSPLPPYSDVTVRMTGAAPFTAPLRVLLASTLKLTAALYNPFAARGQGPVRLTAVAANANRFWRRLPGVLRGRFDRHMDHDEGYLSGRCVSAELLGVEGYALDGESFTADPRRPLRLEAGLSLTVLRA